jgi:hypothetical protein
VVPDELLIRAAFAEKGDAVAAWEEWVRGRDLDALDPVELRLLPRVHRNLAGSGVEVPPVVKQAARAAWVRTRLLLREAAATADLLSKNAIDSILLKGAALAAAFGEIRPMSDFDLLVRPADVGAAIAVLESAGWRRDPRPTKLTHAALFQKGESGCDLHWWVLWESRDAAADERFRAEAVTVELDGVAVRVLRPEHQLLHIIIHGTRSYDVTTARWIGDALAVIRGAEIDWSLLSAEAEARKLAWPVAAALAYLADEFGAPVPRELTDARRPRFLQRWIYEPRPIARKKRRIVVFGVLCSIVWQKLTRRISSPTHPRV